MVAYSIKDLEKLSGVKAHTLRIWEKRYGIIRPKRTQTNIRYYLDEDLKLVLNIALLNRNGYKISKIADMEPEQIQEKVAELSDVDKEFENQLDSLTLSMIDLDEYKFNKILDTNIEQRGFQKTMLEVVYPLLDKLSVMWMSGSIKAVQENFVSNLIRRKTIAAIDKLPINTTPGKPGFIIFLPEGERHELSLLFLHFILREAKFRVINLGSEVNVYDLQDAVKIFDTSHIFTIINDSFNDSPIQPYIENLSTLFPDQTILFSGFQLIRPNVKCPGNCKILSSIKDVQQYIRDYKPKN